MNVVETRVRENYPTILMTILSLIVALVYENLLGSMKEQEGLWALTPEAAFIWSQCAFMLVAPLMFWFAHSLFACSVRPLFVREDALVPVMASVAFIALASNLGTDHAVVWLLGAGSLSAMGNFAMGQFARHYGDDPALSPRPRAHRRSRQLIALTGSLLVPVSLLLHLGVIGYGGAAAVLIVLIPVAFVAVFGVWYAEWRRAVSLDLSAG